MTDSARPSIDDFIDEAFEILTEVAGAGSDLKNRSEFEAAVKKVELGLHTLMGNSRAFGFQHYADVTDEILTKFKTWSSAAEFGSFKGSVAELILEFVAESREYFSEVQGPENVSEDFLASIQQGMKQVEASVQAAPSDELDMPGGRSWEGKVKSILATAPPVRPRIDEIARLAGVEIDPDSEPEPEFQVETELESESDEGAGSEPCPNSPTAAIAKRSAVDIAVAAETLSRAASALASEDSSKLDSGLFEPAGIYDDQDLLADGPSTTVADEIGDDVTMMVSSELFAAVHGFGVESARLLERLESRSEADAASAAKEFLRSFCSWSRDIAWAPASQYLTDVDWPKGDDGEPVRAAMQVVGGEAWIANGPGKAVRSLLSQIVKTISPGPKGDLGVEIETGPERTRVKLSGLAGLNRVTAQLRLYNVCQRATDLDGQVQIDDSGNGLWVEVPNSLVSMAVVVAVAGETRIGLPSHRVVEVRELDGATVPAARESRRVDIGDREVDLLDLTGARHGRGPGGTPDQHPVVVVRVGGELRGILVDAVDDVKEMIVKPVRGPGTSEIEALCVCPEDGSQVPLLGIQQC